MGVNGYAVRWLSEVIRETGYRKIIFKSDDERSIVALKNAVCEMCKHVEFFPQEAMTGDHQANGDTEVAARELKRQVRVLKSSTEAKLKTELKDDDPLLSWRPRHAAFLVGRVRIGEDGKTPYERHTGKRWRRPMITFGEKIFFRPVRSHFTQSKNDYCSRILSGFYVGTDGRNADALVMTKEGIIRGTSIHRRPEEERWNSEEIKECRGMPWDWRPNRQERMPSPMPVSMPEMKEPEVKPSTRDSGPRRLYVRKRDIDVSAGGIGLTPGCPGCEAYAIDGPARSHSDECRRRVQEALEKTEAGQERVD